MTSAPAWKVAFLSPGDDDDRRAVFGDLPFEVLTPRRRDQAGVREILADADILVSDWSGRLVPTGSDLLAAPHLCFVQKPGSGVDDYDVEALTGAGIPLANTAGSTGPSMAEWALGVAIALARRIYDADRWVRDGEWPQLKLADRGAVELAGLNVGVVGFGPVGRKTAELFTAIGCPVSYWSRRRRDEGESSGVPWLPLDELLGHSHVLVVAIALSDETRNLIDHNRLALLPPGAFVINLARGAIIDEKALIDGLQTGRIAGAALDVFEVEPLPGDSPLRSADRVILSPHSSANTPQSRNRLLAALHENLNRVATDEPVQWIVNGLSPRIVRRR